MTFILFIYIIGCVLAFIAFGRIQKQVSTEWTFTDAFLLVFVTACSWLSLISFAIVAIIICFEEIED